MIRKLWAVLAALTLAGLLGAAGARLAWHDPAPLPSEADARALLAPVAPVLWTERFDAVFAHEYDEPWQDWAGSDEYGPGHVGAGTNTADFAALAAALRTDLTGRGWRTGPRSDGDGFTATRGDIGLTVYPSHACGTDSECGGGPAVGEPYEGLALLIERAAPPHLTLFTVAGVVLGLLLGAVAARWVQRRGGPGSRTAGLLGLLVLLPVTLTLVLALVHALILRPVTEPPGALWDPLMSVVLRPFVLVGLPALAFALLGTAARRRTGGWIGSPTSARPAG